MEVARPGAAAGVLFVDGEGRVLLVEPVHEARWSIPGGTVQRGETPRGACVRELHDGLGLDAAVGRLLVVDWAPLVREERVRFVFDGGVLGEDRADGIELDPGRLGSWAFLPPEELFVMVTPRLARRLAAAVAARVAGGPAYLEDGSPIG